MRTLITALAVAGALLLPSAAAAQSGHFITGGANAPSCVDQGTTVGCVGKVAGLDGVTFEITVDAVGEADVRCSNPGNNDDVPGQRTTVQTSGTTGVLETPSNGQYVFSVATLAPVVPNTPTCPNAQWTARVVNVTFTDATLSLFEDGVLVDQVTVPVR